MLTCVPPQASGVTVNSDVLSQYQELKLGKKTRFLIFSLSKDLSEVVVVPTEGNGASATYEDFLTHLPSDQCRWAIFDYEYKLDDGSRRNKLVFFSWCA